MDARNLRGLRVAIYARYSSENQRDASIEDQVRRCREHVERAGGAVDPDLVFADHAVSGASLRRPAFEAMMVLVRAKPRGIDVIVAEDLSRISRDLADAATVARELEFRGIPLIGVADGVNTADESGHLLFALRSSIAQTYLRDLRQKTLRGLEGRALRGHSTGGLPYGYRSREELDAERRIVGHPIEIDDTQAGVVRRVFAEYLDGRSLADIAGRFNAEGVSPPRATSRHRRKGWVASTIRAMLHNAAYTGAWTYKRRTWRKVPGTNRRLPTPRAEGDVIRQTREHLRIIDDETWQAVQVRLREVSARYTKSADGRPKGRSAPGGSTPHLLSGLLTCGTCGAPMVITGGNPTRYYGCSDHHKRRTCPVRLSVREDVAQKRILGAVRGRITSPEGLAYVRARVAERLGELHRVRDAQLAERRDRLARTEKRIEGLVTFIAEGNRSDAVAKALADAEAQARDERAAIAELSRRATEPAQLPPVDAIVERVFDLEARLSADVLRGREALRRLLRGGEIRLHAQGDRYVARMGILPLVLLTPESAMPGSEATPSRASYGDGCGGRI